MLRPTTLASLLLAGTMLAGCNAFDRLAAIGEQPALTQIQNPQADPNYRPVSLPMPAPIVSQHQPNSLWRQGSRQFFKDQRATQVGDILTVIIQINDRGQLQNQTTRTRTNTETDNLNNLLGFTGAIGHFLPGHGTGVPKLADINSNVNNTGTGQINRQEQINLRLAALIDQVLPNGNMVLHGRQEVRINYEVRELQLAGVIRPEDISNQNTISYDQIAEARISYGGRGQLTDVQQPRYGAQFLDVILPF